MGEICVKKHAPYQSMSTHRARRVGVGEGGCHTVKA